MLAEVRQQRAHLQGADRREDAAEVEAEALARRADLRRKQLRQDRAAASRRTTPCMAPAMKAQIRNDVPYSIVRIERRYTAESSDKTQSRQYARRRPNQSPASAASDRADDRADAPDRFASIRAGCATSGRFCVSWPAQVAAHCVAAPGAQQRDAAEARRRAASGARSARRASSSPAVVDATSRGQIAKDRIGVADDGDRPDPTMRAADAQRRSTRPSSAQT